MRDSTGAGVNDSGGRDDFAVEGGRVEPAACRHKLKPASDGTLVCRICGFRKLSDGQPPGAGMRVETSEEKRIRKLRARDPGGFRTRAMRRAELLQDVADFLKDHLRWLLWPWWW